MVNKLEKLPLRFGPLEYVLEFELLEPERFILGGFPRVWRYALSCLELLGRLGDVLLVLGLLRDT